MRRKNARKILFIISLLCLCTLGWACKKPDKGAGKIGAIKRWGISIDERVTSTPALAANGTLYLGTAKNVFYAMSPSGRFLWSFKTEGMPYNPTVASEGSIYFNTSKGMLYALDRNGHELWKRNPRKKLHACAPVLTENGLVLTSGDLLLVSYKADDGKPAPLGKDMPLLRTCVTLGKNGIVYFGSGAALYAWDIKKKKAKWKLKTGKSYSRPALDKNGNIILATEDGRVLSISPEAKINWTYQAPARKPSPKKEGPKHFFISPKISPFNGDIILNRYAEGIYAIDKNGKFRWVFQDPYYPFNGKLAIHPKTGLIYASCGDGSLYAIKPDGHEEYHFATNGQLGAGATISNNGNTVYIGSFDKHLYALHARLRGSYTEKKQKPMLRPFPAYRPPAEASPTPRRKTKAPAKPNTLKKAPAPQKGKAPVPRKNAVPTPRKETKAPVKPTKATKPEPKKEKGKKPAPKPKKR